MDLAAPLNLSIATTYTRERYNYKSFDKAISLYHQSLLLREKKLNMACSLRPSQFFLKISSYSTGDYWPKSEFTPIFIEFGHHLNTFPDFED